MNSPTGTSRTQSRHDSFVAWTIVVTALAIGCVPIVLAAAALSDTPGSAAEWVMVLITSLAVVAAVFAGRWAREAVHLEERREENRLRAEEAGQANLVAAWPSTLTETLSFARMPGGYTTTTNVVAFRNASELPVTNVIAAVRTGEWVLDSLPLAVLPPGTEPTQLAFNDQGQTPYLTEPITVSLEFVDAAGRRWVREYGRPPRLQDPATDEHQRPEPSTS